MSWQAFKQRISDSAIEFALDAFWLAVGGVVVTALAAVYAALKGVSPYWLVGLASAALTFLLVLLITASVVFVKHRAAHRATAIRIGKKGFLDYKMQAQRALGSMNRDMAAMTHQMIRMTKQTTADTKRTQRAQRGWGNTDERAYRVVQRTATHLRKYARVMNLHATNYAIDTNLFIEGSGQWIEWVVTKGGASREQLVEFADLLDKLRESMEAIMPTLEAYRVTVNESRESSQAMDIAGVSLSEAITVITESTRATSAFCAAQVPRLRG